MSRTILIDGENFLYGLRTLAGSEAQKADRQLFLKYPFKDLINEVMGDKKPSHIFYFGARLKVYDNTELLKQKTTSAIKMQAHLVSTLQKQGIGFVKAGHLRPRESEPCTHCSAQEWKLLEKGVDVAIAVRMLAEAEKGAEIVLISSDTDLLPGVSAARQKGAIITYVGYEFRPVLALVKAADATRTITSPMVKKYLIEAQDG